MPKDKEDKFDKPLDTWISEKVDVTVTKPVIDENNKVSFQEFTEQLTQKTMYSRGIKKKLSCKEEDHYWELDNPNTYDFKCRYCMKHKFAYPVTYRYEKGKLIPY
jgi:hypothetical protein